MPTPGTALGQEALTRNNRIDTALRVAGRQIVSHSPGTPCNAYHRCAVTEFAASNGPAEYALIANNRILGILEAKRIGLSVQEVLTQTQRYARGIRPLNHRCSEYGIPLLFPANGKTIRIRSGGTLVTSHPTAYAPAIDETYP